jgi:hypothetical protein
LSFITVFTFYCLLQIVDEFDWEMDDYEVCVEMCFVLLNMLKLLPIKVHLC